MCFFCSVFFSFFAFSLEPWWHLPDHSPPTLWLPPARVVLGFEAAAAVVLGLEAAAAVVS
jgi:hypothetical protein